MHKRNRVIRLWNKNRKVNQWILPTEKILDIGYLGPPLFLYLAMFVQHIVKPNLQFSHPTNTWINHRTSPSVGLTQICQAEDRNTNNLDTKIDLYGIKKTLFRSLIFVFIRGFRQNHKQIDKMIKHEKSRAFGFLLL